MRYPLPSPVDWDVGALLVVSAYACALGAVSVDRFVVVLSASGVDGGWKADLCHVSIWLRTVEGRRVVGELVVRDDGEARGAGSGPCQPRKPVLIDSIRKIEFVRTCELVRISPESYI